MKRNVEATIGELSSSGEGVAIVEVSGERRAVFVAGVAQGEHVRVEADLSKRPARGRLLQVLEPSTSRVVPPCRHHDACGACDWMHLSAEAQASAHASIVASVLPSPVPITIHAAPRGLGYRTRARVHVEARGKSIVVGMHGRRSHDPVPVETCIVLDPVLDAARAALGGWLAGARGRGEAKLSLGAPAGPAGSDGEQARRAVLDLAWKGDLPGEVFARLDRAVSVHDLAGARIFAGDVKVPATIGDATPWIVGADGAPLRLAPGGFSQAGEEGNAELARHVADVARGLTGSRAPAVELYAGAGNLTVLLARDLEVVAVESDAAACDAARANLAARGLTARVVARDAAEHAISKGTRLVVLDPPRTGARDVARALAASPVPAIVYVSCDPPTLGRDLAALAEAYTIRSVDTFEMFPQTSHVETVVALSRSKKK